MDPHLMSNPVALMSRMEEELNEIRRLAIYRGRYYQSAIRRLDCLEEALLAMFEVRLQLMENIILRPRFAAASQSVLVPSAQGGPMSGIRNLEESLFFLKNRVRLLQRRVTNINGTIRRGAASTSRRDGDSSEEVDDNPVGYADIIRRELEKIAQEDTGNKEKVSGADVKRTDHSLQPSQHQPHVRSRKSRSVPNKRSKFTC